VTSLPHLSRKPVHAARGVVATSQPLAASAGLDVLRRGGSAVDAAIAAAATLTVVQPQSNDIGGDLFAIVADGGALFGLNASGRSPAALTPDRLGPSGLPERGWLSTTVPGAPGGWRDLHAKFGRLPFADLFTDAVTLAEEGFPVSNTIGHHWRTGVTRHALMAGPEFAAWPEVFAPGGRAPAAGERFRNPGAARTLRLIADTGAAAFYTGEVAAAIAAHSAATGGLFTVDDLAAHTSTWVTPLRVSYRGYDVWELPPNGQGLAALLALGILDGLEPTPHAQIEAMKLGFADTHAVVADPDLAPAPVDALLDPAYLASRRVLVGEQAGVPVAGPPARGGTVYLCVADQYGQMVSLIQSTYMGFGSFVVIPGYGFGLQNRGCGFTTDPAHPNVVGPRKRPFHTIIPGFLGRYGAPLGPFGVMGGHMQPQGHVQLLSGVIDRGLDPQAALDAPRWYWDEGRRVQVEPEFDPAVVAELRGRGHEVSVVTDRTVMGNGQAIWRLPLGGYVAGSESRTDGYAAAY
jgi:gamma-glutamyltranspeptidase/glutathione hydrolase